MVPIQSDNDVMVNEHVNRMQRQITDCENRMEEIWAELMTALETQENEEMALQLALKYKSEEQNRDKYINALFTLYQKEIDTIQTNGECLTDTQKATISNEMKKMEECCNMGYRAEKFSTDTSFPDDIFKDFLEEVSEKCPLLISTIQSLVVSDSTHRNINKTENYEKLCASQSLAVLLNIRNSRAVNDFVFLFGILCISYGAGKQMINMLSKLGLSLQWDTL